MTSLNVWKTQASMKRRTKTWKWKNWSNDRRCLIKLFSWKMEIVVQEK